MPRPSSTHRLAAAPEDAMGDTGGAQLLRAGEGGSES
jgi:hypothetical protein